MDVKTAFLNGEIDAEIYKDQPEGYVAPENEKKINEYDKCLSLKNTPNEFVIVCLYVDNMINNVIVNTKNMLNRKFDMKDMGLAYMILGIKFERTSNGISSSQSHYIEKVLEKFNAFDDPLATSPLELNVHLKKNRGEPVARLEYARIIGSVMYIINCTHPDLACSVNKLSRFTSNPCHEHWKTLKRVLRYLKYTLDFGLHYTRLPTILKGYNDANWISDTKDSFFTIEYVFTVRGATVSW